MTSCDCCGRETARKSGVCVRCRSYGGNKITDEDSGRRGNGPARMYSMGFVELAANNAIDGWPYDDDDE